MRTIRLIAAALTAAAYISVAVQLATAQTTQWIHIPTDPANTPPAREDAAMVFDEKREVVLMHGGQDAAGDVLGDTWEWNGESWQQVSDVGPTIMHHRMAYDVARDRTVLYGGRWASGGSTNFMNVHQTWEWDGSYWSHIESGDAEPLILFTLVYDPERGKVIRHGGTVNGDYVSADPTTYEWDGTNWTQIAGGSFVRGAQRATYDLARGRTVIFGGSSQTSVPITSVTETPDEWTTWEFDGVEWMQVADTGPAPRAFHGLAFDSYRGVTVLYGGNLNDFVTHYSDTWEWDGVQWTQVNVSGPGKIHTTFAMAFDPKRRKVVLFGGSQAFFDAPVNETWEYGLLPLRMAKPMPPNPDGTIDIQWTGEAPPYQLQSRTSMNEGDWQNEGGPTDALSANVEAPDTMKFFRVVGLFGN